MTVKIGSLEFEQVGNLFLDRRGGLGSKTDNLVNYRESIIESGFYIPRSFALSAEFFKGFLNANRISLGDPEANWKVRVGRFNDRQIHCIEELTKILEGPFIARSSTAHEDNPETRAAGIYHSEMCPVDFRDHKNSESKLTYKRGLINALLKVMESYFCEDSVEFRKKHNIPTNGDLGILIQDIVGSKSAAMRNKHGTYLIEFAPEESGIYDSAMINPIIKILSGLGENVVGGNPFEFVFDADKKEVLGGGGEYGKICKSLCLRLVDDSGRFILPVNGVHEFSAHHFDKGHVKELFEKFINLEQRIGLVNTGLDIEWAKDHRGYEIREIVPDEEEGGFKEYRLAPKMFITQITPTIKTDKKFKIEIPSDVEELIYVTSLTGITRKPIITAEYILIGLDDICKYAHTLQEFNASTQGYVLIIPDWILSECAGQYELHYALFSNSGAVIEYGSKGTHPTGTSAAHFRSLCRSEKIPFLAGKPTRSFKKLKTGAKILSGSYIGNIPVGVAVDERFGVGKFYLHNAK